MLLYVYLWSIAFAMAYVGQTYAIMRNVLWTRAMANTSIAPQDVDTIVGMQAMLAVIFSVLCPVLNTYLAIKFALLQFDKWFTIRT